MKTATTVLSIMCLLLVITSCSTKMTFLNSAVVPAAEGSVKINRDDNKNYVIEVKVKHLAKPTKLQPKRDFYVVWIVTESNGTKNIGQLISRSSFFSSLLEGVLITVTPFKPTSVFITAEDESKIANPRGMVILRTK